MKIKIYTFQDRNKYSLHLFISIAFSFFILLSLNSCKGNVNSPSNEGNIGVIVPGVSVDGVKLGDSRQTVEAILGKPTNVGYADGIYRSWRLYSYDEGTRVNPYVKLQIFFIDTVNNYGPVDGIGIGDAYTGKTKEGIGIGAALTKVHLAYGQPVVSSVSDSILSEKYCLNQKMFEVHYEDSLITTMWMGYYIPLPQDNPCK